MTERDRRNSSRPVPLTFPLAPFLTWIRQGCRTLSAGALRLCICGGAVLTEDLQARWFEATGVELRQGYDLTKAQIDDAVRWWGAVKGYEAA